MWPAPWLLREDRKADLTPFYWQNNAGRPPLIVRLPSGHDFCVDGDYGHGGWTVTGAPPNITVSPSIDDSPGKTYGYHGYLENGVLSDDRDGRMFPRPERS